jgi:ElaB/YqjD/DUF883 family membrane-anchored ribosome-binding protein
MPGRPSDNISLTCNIPLVRTLEKVNSIMMSALPDQLTAEESSTEDASFGFQTAVSKSQEFVEQSILQNPGLCIGAAVAAGVMLGCLIKRV